MSVTQLTAADAPEYRRLMLHAYQHAADAFTSTASERAAESITWWSNRIDSAAGKGVAFGIFYEQQLVATVAIEFSARSKTKHKGHVVGMFVREPYRCLGLGGRLMEAVISYARARDDLSLLTLTATQNNALAINLYKRSGFREFGVEPMAILTTAGYLAKVHMWLALSEKRDVD